MLIKYLLGFQSEKNICWKIVSAVARAVGKPLSGISLQAFEKLSTTTRTQVLESEGVKLMRKLITMCDQGHCGIGKGTSLPSGIFRGTFEMAQTEHPLTYREIFWAILGQQ